MTIATRTTPTSTNGGSDNGVTYTDAVNRAVAALFQCAHNWLTNVGGTANALTADSDATLVEPVASYARPMAFWIVPLVENTGTVTINIDGLGAKDVVDKDGNPLATGSLVAGRAHEIVYDGIRFRLLGVTGASGSPITNVNGGRITIATGIPVLADPVAGALTVRWEPHASREISLFNGSDWDLVTSAAVSIKFTDAQTGTTHNGTKIIDGLADATQLMVGMKISGTNVGAGAVIQSIDSPTQITATVNSSGNGTNTITFKVPADTAVDIFGKAVSSSLYLRGLFRASLLVPNVIAKQDGVDVLSVDHTLRWLGAVISSATDGQIDWTLNGRRRFRVWNRDNKSWFRACEGFTATGTYYRPLGLIDATIDVLGASAGAGSTISGFGLAGGLTSFGSLVSATGGGAPSGATSGADGTGSGGDIIIPGGGMAVGSITFNPGGSVVMASGGRGGRGLRTLNAASIGATEVVTIGAGGAGDKVGASGAILVHELVEI